MATENVPLHLPVLILISQLKKFWFGKKSLASAFWGVGIAGTFFLLAILVLGIKDREPSLWLLILIPVIPAHIVFSLKSIWACSPNVKNKVFGDLAKLFVILYTGFLALGFFGLR